MADPRFEFHQLPDPGFLIQCFLIQYPHRTGSGEATRGHAQHPRGAPESAQERPRLGAVGPCERVLDY
eukprot:3435170-Pyramimonas_sp.AAC.1